MERFTEERWQKRSGDLWYHTYIHHCFGATKADGNYAPRGKPVPGSVRTGFRFPAR